MDSNVNMGFFKRFWSSFTSFSYYKNYIRQSTGKAVVYLILISLFFGIITTIKPVGEFNRAMSSVDEVLERELPNFILEDGELYIEGQMPIIYEDNSQIIFIDTTGSTDESVLDGHFNGMFISRYKMVQKTGNYIQETNFSQLRGASFSKESIKNLLPLLKGFSALIIILWPLAFLGVRFLSALILSLLGLIANSVKGTNLRFGDIYKLSSYAVTLPIIVVAILKIVGYSFPFMVFPMIYFAIGFLYVWNGLEVIREEQLLQYTNESGDGQQ